MILLAFESGLEAQADVLLAAFGKEYGANCSLEKVKSDAVWAREVAWDDLLIVLYQSATLPAVLEAYVQAYRMAHPVTDPQTQVKEPGGWIIPVCVSADPARRRPPDPLAGIRSVFFDSANSAAALAETMRAAGIFLGLALRPGNQGILVSYRVSDGAVMAQSLYNHLRASGYRAWLDAAREGVDLMVAAGDDVQKKIRDQIKDAALIILLDTPDSPGSDWVLQEVDVANSMLIPVLPAVTDGESISRFVPLASLRRIAKLEAVAKAAQPLSDADWHVVLFHLETVLLEGYRRRLRILSVAESTFTKAGYTWKTLEEKRRIFSAERAGKRTKPLVMSHCSIHDIKYVPALRAYNDFVKGYGDTFKYNLKFLLYDRDTPLSDSEWKSLVREVPQIAIDLVHVSEIEIRLHTEGGI